VPKQRSLRDVRNNDSTNHEDGIFIKEETEEVWEEEEVVSDGGRDESANFAVTDVEPKVQAVSQEVSMEAGTGLWTPAHQLLTLQEQYQAARPAREATVTSNDTAHSNHSSSSVEKSQVNPIKMEQFQLFFNI
jgi:hypothetical protein